MDNQAEAQPRAHYGTSAFGNFVTSFCAAICVAGGLGIVVQAFVVAGADLFDLGQAFVMVGSAINLATTLWLFAWCFARSWHVERRLSEGLEIDEPKLSIMANL